MIDRDGKLPVSRQARLLQISRGTVYYMPRPASEADLALMRRIDEMHLEYLFMGQRMLIRQLKRLGVRVGRVHMRTLMRRMGISAMAPQPGTSRPAPGHKTTPTCCATCRSQRPTKFGHWTPPTSRCSVALCT